MWISDDLIDGPGDKLCDPTFCERVWFRYSLGTSVGQLTSHKLWDTGMGDEVVAVVSRWCRVRVI